jgi:hypothetical protein
MGAMFQRCALMLLAIVAVLSTCAARAASLQTITPSQCVWHEGDNPAWAAPSLDERGWKPLSSWKVTPGQTWMWVRCHANLVALHQASQPALQVNEPRAYQLFLNGKLIGQYGNLNNGQASLNPEQTFPVPAGDLAAGIDTVAVRMRSRLMPDPPVITAGEADWLRARHNSNVFAGALSFLPVAAGFGVIGLLGFVLFALYLNDRSHLELLLLAVVCWGLGFLRLWGLLSSAMAPLPAWAFESGVALGMMGVGVQAWFMFRLAGRRVPLLYKIVPFAFAIPLATDRAIQAWFPPAVSQWADFLFQNRGLVSGSRVLQALGLVMAIAPFAAFWPWSRIPRGMRAMAGCAMLWGLVDMAWFLCNGVDQWRPVLLELRAVGTFSAIVALIALLFQEHRRTAEERAMLAGEMQAAQQIQRTLAPASVDTAEGAQVEVAFRPMRDVGGDFYLCRALRDGRQRILLGDVSGKGAAAAMTATLLMGAAERRDADSPAELLTHLNLVLHASHVGGFATCLCADLEPGGEVTLANAGHLAPYLHGEEMAVPPSLPLGLSASDGIYEELRLHLAEGDTLTFLSDGVVEACSATGELFGFERTQAISAQKAEAIAEAAEEYGQQDDITVLTLTRASKPAHVLLEQAFL